jgi:hypothetical protein
MGDILYSNHHHTTHHNTPTTTTNNNTALPPPPLLSLLHSVTSSQSGPSHDYLQTLLNVNDELLAQSLASSSNAADSNSNYDRTDNHSNTQDYHPQLLKATTFVSHHLPILPSISQDSSSDENSATNTAAAALQQQQQAVVNSIVQFTPPITPE